MIVSFDYDHTLTLPHILKTAKKLIPNHTVIITTQQFPNKKLTAFMRAHNFHAIQFTSHKLKYPFLKQVNIHVDNDQNEIKHILLNSPCIPLHTSDINRLEYLLNCE